MATSQLRAAEDSNTQTENSPGCEENTETTSDLKPSIKNWLNMFGGEANNKVESGPPPAQHWLLQMIADQEKQKQSAPKTRTRPACPEETSGCFSRLTFWFVMGKLTAESEQSNGNV